MHSLGAHCIQYSSVHGDPGDYPRRNMVVSQLSVLAANRQSRNLGVTIMWNCHHLL